MTNSRLSSPGFSLVETVVALSIVTVLAAIGAPRLTLASNRYKAELAARQIAADLSLARAQAKSTSAALTVVFSPSTNSYTIASVRSLDNRSSIYTVKLSADPYLSTLVSANFNGVAQVTFDAYGSADNPGRIVVECGGILNSVTLEATSGRASVP